MRFTQRLEDIRDDVVFAVRQLKASPAFALVAVATLALGIGANSAMFALADATLLRPLPFAHAGRLMILSDVKPQGNRTAINPLDLEDWIDRNRSFDAIAGVVGSQSAIAGPAGTAEQVPAQAITARFFDVFGVQPLDPVTFMAVPIVLVAAATVAVAAPAWRAARVEPVMAFRND